MIRFQIKVKRLAAVLGTAAFLSYAYYTSVVRVTKNFHEVDPGKFYRSAQLTPTELAEVIDQYKIKTVVSLRGAPEDSYWFKPQVDVLRQKDVKFVPLAMHTDYFPANPDMRQFADMLRTAERPILVHCRSGADRTGEATAIYAIEFMGQNTEQAIANHLNFNYWHIQFFHPAKSAFVRNWQGLDWAMQQYDLCRNFPQWAGDGSCRPTVATAESDSKVH